MKEYKFKINGNEYVVSVNDIDGTNVEATVNGKPFKIEIDKPVKKQNLGVAPTKPAARTGSVVKPAAVATNQVTLTSPLPGIILEISAKVGDRVKVGQTVMVLEAMKMENVVEANAEGTIISFRDRKSTRLNSSH